MAHSRSEAVPCLMDTNRELSPALARSEIRSREEPMTLRTRMPRALLVGTLCLGLAGLSPNDSPAAAALAKLRALAGDWQGTFQWTGARTDSGKMNVSYSLTGFGSAVVENLIVDGVTSMTSVYHLDGADLRMTHYCGAQNQPRLKARRIEPAQGILDFEFVDITNAPSPGAPHVDGLEMRLRDADHITLTFHFVGAGKESRERIELARVKSKTPAAG